MYAYLLNFGFFRMIAASLFVSLFTELALPGPIRRIQDYLLLFFPTTKNILVHSSCVFSSPRGQRCSVCTPHYHVHVHLDGYVCGWMFI